LVVANTTGIIHIKINNKVVYEKKLTRMLQVSNVQCDAQKTPNHASWWWKVM